LAQEHSPSTFRLLFITGNSLYCTTRLSRGFHFTKNAADGRRVDQKKGSRASAAALIA
jgi:transposase